MSGILTWLVGMFGTQAGAAAGRWVANGAAIVALTPLAVWFLANKDAEAVQFTWGQLAIFGLVLIAFIKVAHYTPPPPPAPWSRWAPKDDQ
jgi:hypothetical protein